MYAKKENFDTKTLQVLQKCTLAQFMSLVLYTAYHQARGTNFYIEENNLEKNIIGIIRFSENYSLYMCINEDGTRNT